MRTKKIMKIITVCYVFFLLSLMFTLESCGQTKNRTHQLKQNTQPNIVLFFVDDLGWSDLGLRNSIFESPNIDKLAKSGISFEQAYIASPTCSPSRATLVTGQHPARLKLVRHIPGGKKHGFNRFGQTTEEFHTLKRDPAQFPSRNWLPLENTTYAEALSKLGYYNLFVGKWHLGHEKFHPNKQGFNQQIGTSNFGHPKSYYPPYFNQDTIFPDSKGRYLTDKLTDETVNFISKYDKQQPFMVSFFYYSVHSPHQGRKDLVDHFESKGLKGKYAHYAAMVKATDESVGRIIKAIEQKGIEKETILIFLSDQGGYFENLPFRGGKMSEALFEGGSRVPFFLYWPGITSPNSINNSLVQSTDLFPTLVEIAGGNTSNYKNIDGISLLHTIKNNDYLKRDPIYAYRAYEDLYVSVREKDWKLLAYRSGKVKLFNITKDIKEQNDLSKEKPKVVEKLINKLIQWESKMGVTSYSGVE
ncbi:sulfatase [Tenacibaculum xiamenense]|uniref:sulfatase n=1 Tax=Tenacibaculum xiamenense TaxID=1261553 RepID=UPI003894D1E8